MIFEKVIPGEYFATYRALITQVIVLKDQHVN